jgi:hypothetical protein
MNMCMFTAIWDITKYEQNVEQDYAEQLDECFRSLRERISPQTIVIWLTAVGDVLRCTNIVVR